MTQPTLTNPRGLTLEVQLPVTINRAEWEKLPVHKLPPTYRYSDHLGAGCFLDPPGYPSYFVQSVYTSYGNTPRKGATMVLFGRVVQTEGYKQESYERLLRRLWNPLPLEHPRTQAWLAASFKHNAHCYRDEQRVSILDSTKGKTDTLVIWPVPSYELKS